MANCSSLSPSVLKTETSTQILSTEDDRGVLNFEWTGCPWQIRPHDLPPRKAIYRIVYLRRRNGNLQRIYDSLRKQVHQHAGKKASPNVGIIDSQSV